MNWRIAKKIFVGILAGVGGLVLLAIMIFALSYWAGKRHVPPKAVLELDFDKEPVEYAPGGSTIRFLLPEILTIRDFVEALDAASRDDRIVGVVARLGGSNMGLAKVQEIRDAVLGFRRAGKPAVCYAETIGEFGPGNITYYLASAFDRIYIQPSGDVGLTGLISEVPFVRSTLDKLGVAPRLDHRKEYKNFMNMFTEREFTGAHREATRAVMHSQFNQIVSGIAQMRRFPEEDLRSLIDKGPFIGKEALNSKLVDGLVYRDEIYDWMKDKLGTDVEFVPLSRYRRAARAGEDGPTVALIYGVGPIHLGESTFSSTAVDNLTMGSDTVTEAFRSAIEDKDVKAILFRVDSPGGSYVASDAIWRETVRARESGKPVIVSMGNVAGSGGYFVAMSADKIVAQPGTLTGSIGVIGGKIVMRELWNKLGVTWDEVHTSDHAAMWTYNRDYTPEEWNRVEAWLDRAYQDFTTKVARGRGLPEEKVREIAKGRIWTGEDAKEVGLVDELGGFPVALQLVRQAIGVPSEASIRLKVISRERSPLGLVLRRIGVFGAEEGAAPLSRISPMFRYFLAKDPLNAGSPIDPLRMPQIAPPY